MEDPVGSRPHVGHSQIARFYDTFIGPREITFAPTADFVAGSAVARDLTLRVRMGPTVTLTIPAVLCYDLRSVDGELKITQLQAYWELPAMMLQFLRQGFGTVPAGLRLMRALVTNQGAVGSMGFLQGFSRPDRGALDTVNGLLSAVTMGDELTTRRMLGRASADVDLDSLAAALDGAHPSKIIASGNSITVSLTAGRTEPRGVLIADFTSGATFRRLRFFS